VLKDLIAGKIDHLHIQFHNCAWSPSEIIRNQGHDTEPDYYYYKQNSHDGGDNKRELAKRHRRLDELSYYQCGFNSGEEQWQSNFKPCFNANAAYSLYGGSGCGKETYINTFYTTDGLYAFLNAIQLDKNNYPSFTAWNYVNQSYYYENAQDLYYYDSYGKKKEKKQPKMKGASQENAYGVEFSANSNAGNSKNNYYGSNGKDYYGNHRELENNANNGNNANNNGQQQKEADADQVVYYSTKLCRNMVNYGYSLGLGCSADNPKQFTIDQFQGYYCLGENYYQTVNSLANLNKDIKSAAGKCIEIYNRHNQVDYASYLLQHSKTCIPAVHGSSCPDPYNKLASCAERMQWSELGVYHMKTAAETRIQYIQGSLFLVLAVCFLILTVLELIEKYRQNNKLDELDSHTQNAKAVEMVEEPNNYTARDSRFDDFAISRKPFDAFSKNWDEKSNRSSDEDTNRDWDDEPGRLTPVRKGAFV